MIGEGLTSGTHINPKNEGAAAADSVSSCIVAPRPSDVQGTAAQLHLSEWGQLQLFVQQVERNHCCTVKTVKGLQRPLILGIYRGPRGQTLTDHELMAYSSDMRWEYPFITCFLYTLYRSIFVAHCKYEIGATIFIALMLCT